MAADNEVNAKLTADTKEAVKDVDKLGDSFDRTGDKAEEAEDQVEGFGEKLSNMGGKMQSVGAALTLGVTAPILGIAGAAINAGLNAVEAESLFETSFGGMADDVRAWSEETSSALGLSEFELRRQSATLFTMTSSMGLSKEAALDMAKGVTVLAGDMASFFNTSPEEAFNKLRSGITGEAEPLKQLGILVTENFIKQTEFAKAILATGRELTEQEKVLARYEAILEQTSIAQGDLARTAESPANRLRAMSSALDDTTTKLGLALIPAIELVLPLLEKLVDFIEDTVNAFAELDPASKGVIIGIVGVVAAIGPVLGILGTLVVAAGSVVTAWGTMGIASLTLTGILGTMATFITGTLLPVLAAMAIGVALGGAIGIAIAEFLEWAGVIESMEDKVRGLVEAMEPSTQQVNAMAEASIIAGERVTDWSEATEILNKNIMAMRDGSADAVNIAGELAKADEDAAAAAANLATEEAAAAKATAAATTASKAAEQARIAEAKATEALVSKLGGEGLVRQAEMTTAAIQKLGGVGKIAQTELEGLGGLIEKLRKNNEELSPELQTVSFELSKMAIMSRAANIALKPIPITAEELQVAIDDVDFGSFADEGSTSMALIAEGLGGLPPKVFDFDNAMSGVNDLLSETRGAMTLFGIETDSVFGKVIEGATKVFDSFNSVLGMADKIIGIFSGGGGGGLSGLFGGLLGGGDGGGGGGGLGGLLGGLFGGGKSAGGVAAGVVPVGLPGLGGAGGIAGALGGGGGAAGGALAGVGSAVSSIGGALGGLLGTIGPIALAAGPFAGLAIGVAFGIRAALKKASAETTAGATGVEFDNLSDELKDRIQEMGEETGDFASALQLNLGDIFAGGGLLGGIDQFSEKIADAFSFLERGSLTAAEAMANIGENIPELLAQFDQLGSEGADNVERLLRASIDTGESFEGQGEVVARFAEQMIAAAEQGGDAWLQANNSLGVSGAETLDFLKNEYGVELPESIKAALNEMLGLGAAINETAGGANQIGEEFASLPDIAAASVEGIKESFDAGGEGIVEGLQPISEMMANEIRQAGEETSSAIDASFASTNEAIRSGLGQVSQTFIGEVAPAALAAARATERIAEAARNAAIAAKSIQFPSGPDGAGEAFGAAAGFRGVLGADTLIQAHRGEFVNIMSASDTSRMDFKSAQTGMGSGIDSGRMGGDTIDASTTVTFVASGNRREDDKTVDRLIKELAAENGKKLSQLQRVMGLRTSGRGMQ